MNPDSSTGNGFWGLMIQSGDLRWNDQYSSTNLWVVDGDPILDGAWHHVAIVKNSNVFKIKYPKKYKKYVASKGSICLDGISLTINEVFDDFFSVNIIPHTEENTSWSKISKGDSINIEFDVLARYVASQLEDRK